MAVEGASFCFSPFVPLSRPPDKCLQYIVRNSPNAWIFPCLSQKYMVKQIPIVFSFFIGLQYSQTSSPLQQSQARTNCLCPELYCVHFRWKCANLRPTAYVCSAQRQGRPLFSCETSKGGRAHSHSILPPILPPLPMCQPSVALRPPAPHFQGHQHGIQAC